jgi:PAS domain S-box-containing protein
MRKSLNGTEAGAAKLDYASLSVVFAVSAAAICALSMPSLFGPESFSASRALLAVAGFASSCILALRWSRVRLPSALVALVCGAVGGLAIVAQVASWDASALVLTFSTLTVAALPVVSERARDRLPLVTAGVAAGFLPFVGLGALLGGSPFAIDGALSLGLTVLALAFLTAETQTQAELPPASFASESDPVELRGLAVARICLFTRDLLTNAFDCRGNCGELWESGPPRSLEELLSRIHTDDRSRFLDASNRCLFEGVRLDVDFRVSGPDGSVKWINARAGIERDSQGSPIAMRGVFLDVTERRQKEERLAASETLHEKIAENIPGIVYQLVRHPDGRREVPYISTSVLEIFGYTTDQVYRDADLMLRVVHPEDREEKEAAAGRSMEDLTLFDWTGRIARPDGEVRWVHLVAMPSRRTDGGILWDGVILDVTAVKLAEREHLATKDRLEWLLRSSPVVMYSCAAQSPHPVTFLSENADDLLGIPVEACLSDPEYWQKRVHPEDQEASQRALETVVETGHATIEYRIRTKRDEYRWLRDEMRFVKDGDGAIVGTVVDVTERRRAQEALRVSDERFRAMSNASPLGVFMTDPEGSVVYVNNKLTEITGAPHEDLYGPKLLALAHPDDVDRVRAAFDESFEARNGLAIQCRLLKADHEPVWCSVKTAPMFDGSTLIGFVGTIEDVTERYELEQESEQSRIAAERANQAKSTFLSRISHELRTPLHAMLGFAQLLQMSDLDENQRESAENILSSGNHLLSLIRDVLDIARAESGELGVMIVPVSLYPLVEEAVKMMQPSAHERGITVDVKFEEEDQVTVLADRQRLRQILLNLVSNAIKYNRREGSVFIGCEVRPDGYAQVTVRDTGAGIPADKVDRLFTPFDRLGAEATDVEGSGLGLTLTKRLVEAMGGTLEVETDERLGTAVTVRLRYAGSRQVASAVVEMQAPYATGDTSERRILLIEDNESNIRLMEGVFMSRPNYKLAVEKSGKAGLEYALQERPDLVLLDMTLPDMVGMRLLERLKSEPGLAGTQVVVISATAEERQIERTRRHGASAYLTKPLDVNQLLKTVDSVLGAAKP